MGGLHSTAKAGREKSPSASRRTTSRYDLSLSVSFEYREAVIPWPLGETTGMEHSHPPRGTANDSTRRLPKGAEGYHETPLRPKTDASNCL